MYFQGPVLEIFFHRAQTTKAKLLMIYQNRSLHCVLVNDHINSLNPIKEHDLHVSTAKSEKWQ